jgi:FO synthase
MGMMLETTSRRLFEEPGGCHFGSPDKDPAVRLRVLEDASRSAVPFTTGILVGIGETVEDRVTSLFELRRIARQYGAIQEVLVQNFRAKPDTAMRRTPDAELEEYLATVAVARLVLGPRMRVQVPPNLSSPEECTRLLGAGVDDFGGISPVTPDHVNPERPWPEIERLAALTAAAGLELRERLTVHPSYALAGSTWLDPRVVPHVRALVDPETGLAAPDAVPVGLPWQEPDSDWESTGRTDLHTGIDEIGRLTATRSDFDAAYGGWGELREQVRSRRPAAAVLGADVKAALRSAERDPAGISDAEALTLITADGPALDELCRLADGLRRDAVGDDVTFVVNRNINFTNVCYTGCRFCAFAQRETDADAYRLSLDEIGQRAEEAWAAGATEVCMQGGIDPKLPGTSYFELVAEVRRRVPDMHIHAFSPMEVVNGATRTGLPVREWLTQAKAAGLDTIPGTAAEILDDEIRWILTKGKLPADLWVEVVRTAHELGIRSSATMMYGHVDEPRHWVAHLRLLARIQRAALDSGVGGFTEFVPLPFIHHNAPVYLAGIARPGPTQRDNRAVHAMARVLLHGAIDNIQCSWVKLGDEGCRDLLQGGVNDIGGTLMEETISRMAGSTFGSLKTVPEMEAIAALAGRPARQRTTTYQPVPEERRAAARGRTLLPLATH